mmetsp:Transcript_22698/g.42669  ORF Transcript_22698/g.42669 Transcript_22698/m.42669 type:complete len:282 (-) Transcript_22698:56-901(-)
MDFHASERLNNLAVSTSNSSLKFCVSFAGSLRGLSRAGGAWLRLLGGAVACVDIEALNLLHENLLESASLGLSLIPLLHELFDHANVSLLIAPQQGQFFSKFPVDGCGVIVFLLHLLRVLDHLPGLLELLLKRQDGLLELLNFLRDTPNLSMGGFGPAAGPLPLPSGWLGTLRPALDALGEIAKVLVPVVPLRALAALSPSLLLGLLAVLLPGLNIPLHVLGLLFTRPLLPLIRQLEFGNVLVILVLVIDDTSFFIDFSPSGSSHGSNAWMSVPGGSTHAL